MQKLAARIGDAQESIFSRMTSLAQEKKAINLAQGFPDFNGPQELITRIHFHLDMCTNQYTRSYGHLALCHALHHYSNRFLPRTYDALDEITVVNGATEGILCTVLALVNPNSKILVFEPFYESYLGCAKMADAELVGVALLPPSESQVDDGMWHVDWTAFDNALNNDVALIILNHPHNPTGKVFNQDELEKIFAKAQKRAIPVAIDGVYENLVYPPNNIDFLPFLPRYSDNIIYISAISKSFSFTGFKIGWVFAPKEYTRGIRTVHQAAVYCQPPHLQLAVADLLEDKAFLQSYFSKFREDFLHMRNDARKALMDFGFYVPNAQGTYFLMAQKHKAPLNTIKDSDLAIELLEQCGIATIPVSGFYVGNPILVDWLRFAFCKRSETLISLRAALTRIERTHLSVEI